MISYPKSAHVYGRMAVGELSWRPSPAVYEVQVTLNSKCIFQNCLKPAVTCWWWWLVCPVAYLPPWQWRSVWRTRMCWRLDTHTRHHRSGWCGQSEASGYGYLVVRSSPRGFRPSSSIPPLESVCRDENEEAWKDVRDIQIYMYRGVYGIYLTCPICFAHVYFPLVIRMFWVLLGSCPLTCRCNTTISQFEINKVHLSI